MRSFTMCCLCFPSALCLVQHLTLCQARCCADQVFLQRNWIKDETVPPCASVRAHTFLAVSYSSTSELLRRTLVLKICQSKDVLFPFTTVLFSWDVAPCQANVSLILERDIPRYLGTHGYAIRRFRLGGMHVALSTLPH